MHLEENKRIRLKTRIQMIPIQMLLSRPSQRCRGVYPLNLRLCRIAWATQRFVSRQRIGFESQKAPEAKQTVVEAQERRVAAETRKLEAHKITMDIKTKRLEREKSLAIIAGLKAGDQMAKTLPPNWEELFAAA